MSETAQGPNRAERRRMVKKNQIKGGLLTQKDIDRLKMFSPGRELKMRGVL